MAKVKTMRVFSFAKFQAVLTAPVGLIAGILYSFGGAIYDVLTTGSVNLGTALAFFALIALPILFAIFGFITGVIGASLNNISCKIGWWNRKWLNK